MATNAGGTAEQPRGKAEQAGDKAKQAGDSKSLEMVARVGLVAYGVVHLLIGGWPCRSRGARPARAPTAPVP
jgi:hypothetical protein